MICIYPLALAIRICFKIIANMCLNLLFWGLSEALWGIFTLSRLVNRPLFTAP